MACAGEIANAGVRVQRRQSPEEIGEDAVEDVMTTSLGGLQHGYQDKYAEIQWS